MMNRRDGVLVLLFCALLIAGCAAPPAPQLSATPTQPVVTVESASASIATEMPEPTAALQRYTNEEAGFSIGYPAGWTQESLPDQNAGLLKGVSR